MKPKRITGPWRLSELPQIEKNGLTVFSCFHCGGGSTMGYKLAGFDVLGGVEIDPKIMAIYRANHAPLHSYLMGVGEFAKLPDGDIPAELFNLDILDGSPPCSVFSMAGDREKKWGGEHHFREGQKAQRLDDLFFEFIAIAAKLKPKVVVAENVRGLICGNAKGYVKQIFTASREAGYSTQLFLLNASRMGVPQRRERTFFIAVRNDLKKRVSLSFNEAPILLREVLEPNAIRNVQPKYNEMKPFIRCGDRNLAAADERMRGKVSFFNHILLRANDVCNTLTTNSGNMHLIEYGGGALTDSEETLIQTFPQDFNYCGINQSYLKGMSVPPYMMQRVALEIGRQVFNVDYDMAIDIRA